VVGYFVGEEGERRLELYDASLHVGYPAREVENLHLGFDLPQTGSRLCLSCVGVGKRGVVLACIFLLFRSNPVPQDRVLFVQSVDCFVLLCHLSLQGLVRANKLPPRVLQFGAAGAGVSEVRTSGAVAELDMVLEDRVWLRRSRGREARGWARTWVSRHLGWVIENRRILAGYVNASQARDT